MRKKKCLVISTFQSVHNSPLVAIVRPFPGLFVVKLFFVLLFLSPLESCFLVINGLTSLFLQVPLHVDVL